MFVDAVINNNIDLINKLLTFKDHNDNYLVNLNHTDYEKSTVLLLAAEEGYTEIVKILVELQDNNGNPIININSVDKFGKTAMDYLQNDDSMKQFLRKHGAQELKTDNNTVENFSKNPQFAHTHAEQEVLKILSGLQEKF